MIYLNIMSFVLIYSLAVGYILWKSCLMKWKLPSKHFIFDFKSQNELWCFHIFALGRRH